MKFLYANQKERQELKTALSTFDNLDPNKKTILFTVPSETGTSYFRVLTPLFAMAEKAPDAFNYVYCEQEQFPITWLQDVDVWVQHRAGGVHSFYLKMVKKFPIDVKSPVNIHDVDDDEVNLPPNHAMKQMWYGTSKHEMAKYQLGNVDFISTTGRMLKREFMKYQKPDNIKIFRNMFNWALPQWNLEKPKHKNITIGWAGLTSHFDDLKKMAIILKKIHDTYPDVEFKIAGITRTDEQYKYIDENGEKKFIKEKVNDYKNTYHYRITQLFKDFNKDRIEFFGVLPLEQYGEFYTKWDINLAYVEHNGFNSRKSEIKIVEGARYKNINIYSNIGGYQEYTNNLPAELKSVHLKHCAMRTEQTTEWVNAISYWINAIKNNDPVVDFVVNGAYDYVSKEYDIYNKVDEYVAFYNECYDKVHKFRIEE